jgi:hypothetical protein
MSDEKWLREGLADAVPEPPINPDRASAAERLARRRRRTTALAVVGTAGAVAAAAVLTATLASGGDDPDRDAVDTASEGPSFVVECPPIKVDKGGVAEESEIDQPDPDAPDAVPEGATSARLCQGPGTTFGVPDEALTTGVDDLVAAVNDLEPTGPPEVCTLELGPGYRIAFGYDDGSTFVVSGRLYGCQSVVVGSGYRTSPEAAQAAFLELLDAQQQEADGASPDDAATADPSCPDDGAQQYSYNEPIGGPSFEEILSGLTAAILCIDDGSGPASTEIDDADLEQLAHDMAINQSTAVLRCAAATPFPAIFATDADGKLLAIFSECGTSFWRLPNGKAWMPSDDAVAILDRLVSEAR